MIGEQQRHASLEGTTNEHTAWSWQHQHSLTATTHYGWDGDRIVHEETNNQRTTVIYEPGSFVPMLRIDETQGPQGNQNTQLSAYITDALGTPLQLLSPNGQPRWLAEPDDWAAVTKQRAVPIRFQGQWHDEESGLYYNRHRYYDPEQGRYISQDPIGLRGGTNLYGYVTNPTGMVDPLGLEGAPAYGHFYPVQHRPNSPHYQGEITPKEGLEAVSIVAGLCSLIPPATAVCGSISIGAAASASGIEASDGNYHQAGLDIAPTIAAETTGFIFKRATLAADAVSNAIGVATGFKSQYWINKDNYIDREGECQYVE
ncbi:RHS repeat-associated core domain-containing protein [Vreelandella alkaliphila]|uniref:RHS protein conserved region domain-containing protein n=1 Tax=Vreelandella alkaliphila TaxID=272774 RepID=A0A7C9NP07_9GAMM|nr:RHS repeat-associated core domain-containing protein [Halomonas alkaliphila]NDL69728.1 hypothetical protein [Halomonas alkaliphila]